MKAIVPSNKVYLSKSAIPNAGRGVFASKDITPGEIIEICPVITIPHNECGHLSKTPLVNYYFSWGKGNETVALCMGFGSMYNHSYEPNATYVKDFNHLTIMFTALYPIKKDEEITVNYNHGNPDDKSSLWMLDVPPSNSSKE